MITKTLNILKKNRKYFAATDRGYKVKLLIDDNSKDLELGEQELLLDDISVVTAYGRDVIYKLAADSKEQKDAGICTLKADYNEILVQRCRELGGRFDNGAWVFSALVEDEVELLDELYNSEKVAIEIIAKGDLVETCAPVYFAGYKIAEAKSRDGGALAFTPLVSGRVRSGGSMKNWATIIEKGATMRMEIPKLVLQQHEKDEGNCWDIKIL